MNVRRASLSTLSLIVFFTAVYFLIPVVASIAPQSFVYILFARSSIELLIGSFHANLINLIGWAIIFVGVVDAILRQKVGFMVIGSFIVPILLVALELLATRVSFSNPIIFLALVYALLILSLYITFRKFRGGNVAHPTKLFAFIKEIKSTKIYDSHVSDHYIVLAVSTAVAALLMVSLVSFGVFIVSNRIQLFGWFV